MGRFWTFELLYFVVILVDVSQWNGNNQYNLTCSVSQELQHLPCKQRWLNCPSNSDSELFPTFDSRCLSCWWFQIAASAKTAPKTPSKCSSSAKCSVSQCCLGDISWSQLTQTSGKCTPRTPPGGSCFVANLLSKYRSTVFNDACPCQNGYFCDGNGVTNEVRGEMGTCQRSCSNSKDCGTDECCATMETPDKRKKRETYLGLCKKLTQTGDPCHTRDAIGDDVNFRCPCASGLYCQGKAGALDEGPLGAPGNCTVTQEMVRYAIPGK